jgi:septal ring factor EnvC (AmiA/AmiB activator)
MKQSGNTDNMNDARNTPEYEIRDEKSSRFPFAGLALGLGLAVAVAVAGLGFWQHAGMVNMRLEMAEMQKEMKVLRQAANESDSQLLESLESVRNELDSTRKQSEQSVEQARAALRRQTDIIASRLTKRQEEQSRQLAEQLDEIKTTTEEASARLTDITTDVGAVRTEVASTRGELDKTISDLRRTTGDMGVMSGLIATNRHELQALRALGERDYYEFTITRDQKQQRIGDIVMQVKRTDPRRNRFTIDIVADDKRVEKKDKTVNEPVQFYVLSRARVPYELVINEVRKDTLVGYLAMPKVKMTAQR